MRGFGFFGKMMTKVDYTHSGTLLSGTRRLYPLSVSLFPQFANTVRHTVLELTNPALAPLPDVMQLISGVEIPYVQTDFRTSIDNTINTVRIGSSYLDGVTVVAPNPTGKRGFIRNNQTLVSRAMRQTFTRPELMRIYGLGDVGSSGSNIGTFTLPFFPYLIHFYQSVAQRITNLRGRLPENLNTFYWDSDTVLSSIAPPLPTNLKNLFLYVNNSVLRVGTSISAVISIAQLESLFLMRYEGTANIEFFDGDTAGALNISGTLTIPSTKLRTLAITAVSLTNIIYSTTQLDFVMLLTCTALNATTFRNIFNLWCSGPNQKGLSVRNSYQTWTRDIVNADFTTATQFCISGNRFTGNIAITESKPIQRFFTGIATEILGDPADKHNFTTADVSGLNAATSIDLSNSQIQFFIPPSAPVVTVLALGGNKLDVVTDPLLWTKIRSLSATLVGLRTSTWFVGYETGIELGQNSVNGIGNDVDLSMFPAMTSFVASSSKMGGVITLGPVQTLLYANDNPFTGIAGTGITLLTILRANGCPNFVFDWTRASINLNTAEQSLSTGQTIVDLRSKTGTLEWQAIRISTMPNLTTIHFPTLATRGIITTSPNIGYIFIHANPLLTTLTNLDKMSWDILTTNTRLFYAYSCSLNITFPLGTNNFLPSSIQLHDNTMSLANVNANIDLLYTNKAKWNTTVQTKLLNIGGTTAPNSPPSGLYKAPAGFVLGSADGTPANQREKLYVLANNYAWGITFNNWGLVAPTLVQKKVNGILPSSSSLATITLDSPVTAGNAIVFVVTTNANRTITPPAGFILLYNNTSAGLITLYTFWKIADGTEGTTFNFTLVEGGSGWCVNAWECAGFNPDNPISKIGNSSGTAVTTGTMTAAVTHNPNDLILIACRNNNGAATTFTDADFEANKISYTTHQYATDTIETVVTSTTVPVTFSKSTNYNTVVLKINFAA